MRWALDPALDTGFCTGSCMYYSAPGLGTCIGLCWIWSWPCDLSWLIPLVSCPRRTTLCWVLGRALNPGSCHHVVPQWTGHRVLHLALSPALAYSTSSLTTSYHRASCGRCLSSVGPGAGRRGGVWSRAASVVWTEIMYRRAAGCPACWWCRRIWATSGCWGRFWTWWCRI